MTAKQVQEFKETEIGKIPADWEVKKISEIAPTKNCVQTGPFGSLLHAHDYQEEGYPLILVKHVKDGKIIEDNLPKIGETKYSQLSKFILKAGDIVFTRVGYVGNTAYTENKHVGWLISGQMLRIRIDNPQINNRFVSYFFLTNKFKNIASSVVLGSTRDSINTQILKDIPIPIPSKEEQDKITSIIQSLIKKIQYLNDQNKILEQTAQAIFKSWFVDFDGQTEFEDSELGKIPKGWSVNPISKNSEVVVGYVGPVSKHYCKKLDGIPMIRTTDLKEYGINDTDLKYVTKEFHYKQKKSQLKKGDILIARFGKSGLPCLFDQEYDANCLNAVLIKPDQKECLSYYLLNTLKTSTLQVQFQGSIVGTVQDCLNTKTIAATLIFIPSKSILQEFDSFVKPIYSKIKQNNFSIYNSTVIRDALLPKLMSGEIRV